MLYLSYIPAIGRWRRVELSISKFHSNLWQHLIDADAWFFQHLPYEKQLVCVGDPTWPYYPPSTLQARLHSSWFPERWQDNGLRLLQVLVEFEVHRSHQESACRACNLPPSLSIEKNGTAFSWMSCAFRSGQWAKPSLEKPWFVCDNNPIKLEQKQNNRILYIYI